MGPSRLSGLLRRAPRRPEAEARGFPQAAVGTTSSREPRSAAIQLRESECSKNTARMQMNHFQSANQGHPDASRFLPFEWTVQVEETLAGDGGIHYVADLYRSGELMCRIGLSGTFSERALAEEALWRRLKTWLEDYEMRPHSGDTGFQIL